MNEDDTIQTACDKLKQVFNEAASNSYLKREKNTIKLSVSTRSSDLIEQRRSAHKKIPIPPLSKNYVTWRNIVGVADYITCE